MAPAIEARRPLHGSCHCGRVKYVLFASMPPAIALGDDVNKRSRVRFYKCNCSTCHKMGFFHMRLPDPPQDFFLLSPTKPREALGDYTCFDHELHWLFCRHCGVRCFTVQGEGQSASVDLRALGVKTASPDPVTVWQLDPEAWKNQPEGHGYLSVNALTLDWVQPDGAGLDLRTLVDNRWLEFLDCKDEKADDRYDYPHEGGSW